MKALVIFLAVLWSSPLALADMRDASLPEPPLTPADIHNHGILLQMMVPWVTVAIITLTWITFWGIRMIRRIRP